MAGGQAGPCGWFGLRPPGWEVVIWAAAVASMGASPAEWAVIVAIIINQPPAAPHLDAILHSHGVQAVLGVSHAEPLAATAGAHRGRGRVGRDVKCGAVRCESGGHGVAVAIGRELGASLCGWRCTAGHKVNWPCACACPNCRHYILKMARQRRRSPVVPPHSIGALLGAGAGDVLAVAGGGKVALGAAAQVVLGLNHRHLAAHTS